MAQRNLQRFCGYRRENGRVGVRNHVPSCRSTISPTPPCEAVAAHIQGHARDSPMPTGACSLARTSSLHFRTLIGTGSNPNVAAVIVIGIEPVWTRRVVDGIAQDRQAGRGFLDRGARRHRHGRGGLPQGQGVRPLGLGAGRARVCDSTDVWIAAKCGESDTTTGLASCPTVGNMYDKLVPKGSTAVSARPPSSPARSTWRAARAATPEIAREVHAHLAGLPERCDRGPQDLRPLRQPADQGQHRRRPHHDRGKGARQSREDRPQLPLHRRAGAGRSAGERCRPLFHGHLLGGGRMLHAAGGRAARWSTPSRPARAT